jgi:toxin FitB
MILLDTNVVSELMRPAPDVKVLNWFETQSGTPLFFSTVSEAELWAGVSRLPEGKRRSVLLDMIAGMLNEDFAQRILVFDRAAAHAFGRIHAERIKLGKPIATADCQIAAIAYANRFQLATRNCRDFLDCGVSLIDPWTVN